MASDKLVNQPHYKVHSSAQERWVTTSVAPLPTQGASTFDPPVIVRRSEGELPPLRVGVTLYSGGVSYHAVINYEDLA